jgi:uncharacterized protein (TIGR02246 family)
MVALVASIGALACSPGSAPPGRPHLEDLAARYAEAWSSQDPERLASFYAADGSLIVNGSPSVGRDAIRATAGAFMAQFPDMQVTPDSVVARDDGAVFHWHWTGTATGPGGTGRRVDLRGFEEWTLSPDGLIVVSDGHYDEAEFSRQMEAELP